MIQRRVQIALHDVGLDKKNTQPLSSLCANDVEFACQDRRGADKVQVHHNASSVLGAGLSAFDTASERGSEKDVGAQSLKRIGRDLVGRPRSADTLSSCPTRGTVVDGEGGH